MSLEIQQEEFGGDDGGDDDDVQFPHPFDEFEEDSVPQAWTVRSSI